MLRLKSTLAAQPPSLPVAPESGLWPLRSSFAFFAKDDGFRLRHERFDTLHKLLGPIYKIRFLPLQKYMVTIADPAAVAQIYWHKGPMPQRRVNPTWKVHRDARQWPIGSVNTNEFAEWKRFRRSLSAHVLQAHNVAAWLPRLDDVAQDIVARIRSQAVTDNSVPMTRVTQAYALEAASALVFGRRMGCVSRDHLTPIDAEAQAFIGAVDGFAAMTQVLGRVPPFVPHWAYRFLPSYQAFAAHSDVIFALGETRMRQKMASTEETDPDLLSMFLARPELDERDAIAQAVDVLLASVDTTTNALLWTLYLLASSPNGRAMQETIRDEANAALGGNASFDDAALEKVSYVRAVVKEALRLYPVANPNQRYLTSDLTLLGHKIPAGTSVLVATYTMSRDPNVFENPTAFVPERWMNKASNRQAAAYSTLPFGMGARSCVGRRLAETEMYLLLSHLLRTMEVSWIATEAHPKAVIHLLMTPETELTLRFQPW
ncbi:hypothetical protein SDRG_15895 [Saprolegnia diclina VS20]|uniref:Cytochrome P450 n=1 Tax=Saprolegnia diclina (strain VS20) TaxID=1156394 RepID=T0R2Q4_SAPDV|nr:hypothetical protein SDRG_15895 [Saprolegnia diclina VS20]EQC26308.1 hypothetical protein SDRG_15895 [Saprolegnia diclina VS20]|eukprot:XP_008620303.1 hypothetical protein SDRG_15895 [Saprolegnia diclina VS20]